MINKKKINTDIDQIVNEITHKMSDVEAIYLFGSMVGGKITSKSDYDIAVIASKYPGNDLELVTNIKYSLIDKIKRPIDIVILDINDLSHSSIFLYELYHNHKKLYGKEDILKKSRHAIEKVSPIVEENKRIGYYV
ncbi:MAG: nucleotidyltransferase domain-containing protein [Methanocella sp.]